MGWMPTKTSPRSGGCNRNFLAVCALGLISTTLLNQRAFLRSTMRKNTSPNYTPPPSTTTTKLADGCYHVFLDVGSNIGNHVRFLYESQLYPKARIARRFFEEAFGSQANRDNRNICVFSFEPNPDHNVRHAQLQEAYGSLGWSYHPINAGVGHQYGNITFYHTWDDLGFTSKQSSCRRRCDPVDVPVIQLSDWVKREVAGRKIPQYLYGKDKSVMVPPRVVMKLDIEMMEYEVFPDLMLSGALCDNIHSIIGEFHMGGVIAYLWGKGINFTSVDGTTWNLHRDVARSISEDWLRMIDHNPNCVTKISMEDDESYRNDGQPLPTVVAQNDTTAGS